MTAEHAARPEFPALETERLLLRSLEGGDLPFVLSHFGDPQVTRYLLDSPPLRSENEARELIEFYATREGHGPNRWCIVRRADDTAIGTCGFHCWEPQHRRAEIGYDLSPAAWGHGYMTEVLRAAITHGFERLELNRIEALVYGENRRSIKLLERLGFRAEATLRDDFERDGEAYDHELYALLQRDRPSGRNGS